MSLSTSGMSVGGAPSGGDPFAVARMLVDPDAYKAKLDALQQARSDAERLISLVGPAQDIPRMNDEAKAALAQANAILETAKADATAKGVEAQAAADAMAAEAAAALAEAKETLAAAKAEASAITAKARKFEKDAEAKAAARDADLTAAEAAVHQRGVDADAALDAAVTAKAEADAVTAKYAALIADIVRIVESAK